MKKTLATVAALGLGLTLAACGGVNEAKPIPAVTVTQSATTEPATQTATETATETQAPTEGLHKIGDTFEVGPGVTAQVTKKETVTESGEKVLAVYVIQTNNGSETVSLGNSMFWSLLDSEGVQMDSAWVMNDKYPELTVRNARPGTKAQGWVFFKAPKSLKGAYLQYDNFQTTFDVAIG